MTSMDLLDSFNQKTTVNLPRAEEKLKQCYNRLWSNSVNNTPKLRTYKLFKDQFSLEEYITLNLPKYERSLLAQLRCGILPLRVETGRYVGEPVIERLCRFCQSAEIENETHFIITCTHYHALRITTFGTIIEDTVFSHMTPDEKLVYIMKNHVRKLSKFIVKAYLHRRNSLYLPV